MGTARMAEPTYEQLEARVNQLQVEDTQLRSQVPRLEARVVQLERFLDKATDTAARFPHRVKKFLQDSLALRDRRDAGRISDHGLALGRCFDRQGGQAAVRLPLPHRQEALFTALPARASCKPTACQRIRSLALGVRTSAAPRAGSQFVSPIGTTPKTPRTLGDGLGDLYCVSGCHDCLLQLTSNIQCAPQAPNQF